MQFCILVSAFTDICNRFPDLIVCRVNEAPVAGNNPSLPTNNVVHENLNTEDEIISNQDYCSKYQSRYNFYCDGHIKDGVIVNFCREYQSKCLYMDFVTIYPPTTTTNAEVKPSVTPSPVELQRYCSTYTKAYSKYCKKEIIRQDAVPFCNGYPTYCTVPADTDNYSNQASGFHSNTVAEGDTNNRKYSEHIKGSQPQVPIHTDGNIGSMLGIPMVGGSPLDGLGHVNDPHIPEFGGPVNGGFGFGKSLFAPYFGANKGFNIVPTKSFTEGENYNVAGIKVGRSSNVDWSGTPGLGVVNSALGQNDGFYNGGNGFGVGKK